MRGARGRVQRRLGQRSFGTYPTVKVNKVRRNGERSNAPADDPQGGDLAKTC